MLVNGLNGGYVGEFNAVFRFFHPFNTFFDGLYVLCKCIALVDVLTRLILAGLHHACAVDVLHSCRGRRMLREILMPNWFGWPWRYRLVVTWGDHPRWRVQ